MAKEQGSWSIEA
jgi:hypothetical protein